MSKMVEWTLLIQKNVLWVVDIMVKLSDIYWLFLPCSDNCLSILWWQWMLFAPFMGLWFLLVWVTDWSLSSAGKMVQKSLYRLYLLRSNSMLMLCLKCTCTPFIWKKVLLRYSNFEKKKVREYMKCNIRMSFIWQKKCGAFHYILDVLQQFM